MTIRPSLISAVLLLLLAPSLLVSCGDQCTTCPTDLGDWPVANPSSQGMNAPLLDFFPEYPSVENDGAWKRAITLEHALRMQTGIEWDEWSVNYGTPDNPLTALYSSDDWIRHMLDQPMVSEPGSEFVYNTGVSLLLSGVLQNSVGVSAETFARDVLFEPMGIHQWDWYTGPNGVTDTGGGLLLRPRDMAKFGYLYLHGGQRIYVVPQLDLVVVMTAEGYNDEPTYRTEILFDYVFPSADPTWASAQALVPDVEFVGQ